MFWETKSGSGRAPPALFLFKIGSSPAPPPARSRFSDRVPIEHASSACRQFQFCCHGRVRGRLVRVTRRRVSKPLFDTNPPLVRRGRTAASDVSPLPVRASPERPMRWSLHSELLRVQASLCVPQRFLGLAQCARLGASADVWTESTEADRGSDRPLLKAAGSQHEPSLSPL